MPCQDVSYTKMPFSHFDTQKYVFTVIHTIEKINSGLESTN